MLVEILQESDRGVGVRGAGNIGVEAAGGGSAGGGSGELGAGHLGDWSMAVASIFEGIFRTVR